MLDSSCLPMSSAYVSRLPVICETAMLKRSAKITGTGGKDKTAVMGILERGGRVRTKVIDNTKKKTLQAEIRDNVLAGAAIFTDALQSYEGSALRM